MPWVIKHECRLAGPGVLSPGVVPARSFKEAEGESLVKLWEGQGKITGPCNPGKGSRYSLGSCGTDRKAFYRP